MTVVTFALPDESRDFVARLGPTCRCPGRLPICSGRIGGESVVAFHTGVGNNAERRERWGNFLADPANPVRLVVCSGYAGALRPGVRVGDVILGENVSDPALLGVARRALADEPGGVHVGALHTAEAAVETAAAKAALFAATGRALAVDMETAWVAGACARAGVPLLALRVISDASDLDFPVPGGVIFDPGRQRPRFVALPAYLLTHPAQIGPFVRFVRGLGPARARLAAALEKVIVALAGG